MNTGKQIKTFFGHRGPVTAIAKYSNDSFLTGSQDCKIKLWNVNEKKWLYSFIGHTDTISSIVVTSPDRFLSASNDGTSKKMNHQLYLKYNLNFLLLKNYLLNKKK